MNAARIAGITLACILLLASFSIGRAIGHGSHVPACHFDGGGTIVAGALATTTDGHTFACAGNGNLYRVVAP